MKLPYNIYSKTNQRIIDALITGAAFWLAYQFRFEGRIPPSYTYQLWLLLPGVMIWCVLTKFLFGSYRPMWRYFNLMDVPLVVRGHIAFSVILLLFRLGLPDRWAILRIPISIIVMEFLLGLVGELSARALRRILYRRQGQSTQRSDHRRSLVLVGAGTVGSMVAKEMSDHPAVKLVGFLDDDKKKIGSMINGVPIIGPIDHLPSLVKEQNIDEVVVCISRSPRITLKRIWLLCENLPVRAKIVPTLDEILHRDFSVSAFRDIQMADLLGRETAALSSNPPGILQAYRRRRVLITGAGGSIGSELARQLIKYDVERLVLLDKDENGLYDIYLELSSNSRKLRIDPIVADIRYSDRLQAVFSRFRPDVVFHAAAHKHVPLMEMNPCEAILNNVVGTRNVVAQCMAFGASTFVLISTDKAVRPRGIMGASKRVCEMIVQAQRDSRSTRFFCVRFGNVLGSRGSVIPLFQKQIAAGGPVTVTHPEARRFLMTIPEAVQLVVQSATLESTGGVFALDMGDPVPILQLANDLIELSGLRPGKDIDIESVGLRPGEKIAEELFDRRSETLSRTRLDRVLEIKGQLFEVRVFNKKLAGLEDAARRDAPEEIFRIIEELNVGFSRLGRLVPSCRTAG